MSYQKTHLVASAVLLLTLVWSSDAFQVGCWHWGRCPDLDVQQNFNISKYQGVWYEQGGYNTYSLEGYKRCVYANYTFNETSSLLYIENRGISNYTNKWGGINGTAVQDNPSKNEGKLTVTFHPAWWLTISGNYWVLSTDYNDYTVVYSCTNHLFFFHEYTIWYLSRSQRFASREHEWRYFNISNTVVQDHGIDPSLIQRSSQGDCDVGAQ